MFFSKGCSWDEKNEPQYVRLKISKTYSVTIVFHITTPNISESFQLTLKTGIE